METPPREPGRKTPEEILESLEREARGKLTIYLGSSAGVGKTYSMLEAARERKSSAIDVVVGWIETHGRKETEKLAEGLERVPPLVLDYKGKSFNEMDLDGVLERKPGLVLVDELAHTNVAGSRHARRFQDVEELLRAGINVYTTINIQHVESLNDVVAQITGILVRETVPDRIVEEADFIRLIDISADELISRLKEGKVYVPAQAEQALLKFFRPGNLNALRELAMRFAARRVDREISGYMKEHHIEGPWPMGGNVMVCVSGSPFSAQLIRAAFQLSQGLRSEWLAVHVESGRRHFPMGDRERARLEKNMRLAEELGAKTFTAVGENLVREILDIARVHNVSALVVGKPRHNRLWDFVYGSLVDELIRKSEKLNIYVIQAGEARESAPVIKTGTSVGGFNWKHHAGSLFMVAIITALGLHFREELNHLNIAFLYLLVVVLSASWWGRWPSYTAAVTGVALFDFLFIPPIYTFSVHDLRYMWSFAIFLVVAFIIGGKTESLRKEAQAARLREKSTRTLYEFGREIAGVMDLRMISRELCREVAETLEREVVVLFPGREGELTPASCYSPFLRNGDREMLDLHSVPMARRMLDGFTQAVASWTFKNARVAGRSTETFSECPFLFLPLLAKGKAEGVLGINLGEQELLPEQWRLLETWVKLAAIAIERATLQEQAQETALIVESERLHTALFNSLSHELKTPLASIIGSVSTLIESSEIYTPSQKKELLDEIKMGALRLERVVVNLLDTARLESGMLEIKLESVEAEDLVGTSLGHMKDLLKDVTVEIDIEPGVPFIRGDSVLLELVLVNLLDNVLKYSRPDGTITIHVSLVEDKVKFSVSDEGPGIPEDDLARIFHKFYRVKAAERGAPGSGLGLSICKAIVELHGGVIGAENRQGGAPGYSSPSLRPPR